MAKLLLNRQNSKIQLYAHKVTTYLEMSDVEIMFIRLYFIFKNASHIYTFFIFCFMESKKNVY